VDELVQGLLAGVGEELRFRPTASPAWTSSGSSGVTALVA
jgi:hypothetical protein